MTPFCEGSVRDKKQSITHQKAINQQVIKISEGVRDEHIFSFLF
ncbi:hypothetical protein SAMN05444405_1245 [Bacteroides luti]|uniref:Uncharacterized protein n=1 Tax=Bacteroides luti TaxID=1297750 RepID=A0A1M5H4S7_9BACE|nr:hypothetical protein SAMN05444405_1245 [Bacteroides luti]